MKFLIIVNFLSGIYLTYLLWAPTSGQYYEDPTLFFKPFKLESKLRGSYNVSQCIQEVLNCWELVTPEVFCDAKVAYHDSYCTTLKRFCQDLEGPHSIYNDWYRGFVAIEYECKHDNRENYT